jgi:Aspartyl/Asparaginyl beta-hydroxylase
VTRGIALSATAWQRGEPLSLDAPTLRRVIEWIDAIPFESWPQQQRLADGQIRPAMVTDLAWQSFGEVTDELVRRATPPGAYCERNRLLSVVMPGALIDPHTDELGADWCTRMHVPLLTNPDAMFISGDRVQRMAVGFAYEINTRERHAVWNAGETPRVHLMFDLHRA